MHGAPPPPPAHDPSQGPPPQAPSGGPGPLDMDDMPGAQVASMMAIVQAVVSKTVPAPAAAVMLQVAFPRRIDARVAAQLVASAAVAPLPPGQVDPAIPGEAPPSGDG
jgi:hypothetical protein